MTDRVHACLDGEIPREELSPAELARLEALEATLAPRPRRRCATAPVPDLTARVMARAAPHRRRAGRALWRRCAAGSWTPRTLTLRYRPA